MGVGTPTAAETAGWVTSLLAPGTRIRVLSTQRRALAVIHTLEVVAPDGSTRRVLAKCGVAAPDEPPSRPNLAPPAADTTSSILEHAAAIRLHDLMGSVEGVRAPAVLAHRDVPPTLVLERLPGATDLTRLFRRAAAAPAPSIRRRVLDASAAAGRAARRMADAGPLPDRRTSHRDAAHLLTTARAMAAFLDDGARPLAEAVVHRAGELLQGVEAWPVVAGHGDFAPRNVLVLDHGIAVIDALFAANVPRFEDPARFVVNILAPLAEIPFPTPGARRIARETVEVFLAECVPDDHRALFEATCLVVALDRWCALSARAPRAPRMRVRTGTGLRAMPGVVRQLLDRTA